MINPGLKSFLFSQVLAKDFAEQFEKMVTNHPDRKKVEITLKYKTGEGENDHITHKVCGYFKCDCPNCNAEAAMCTTCKKIEEKLLKITTLDGYKTITAEVRKIDEGRVLALINY
jgi:hypothetical protein